MSCLTPRMYVCDDCGDDKHKDDRHFQVDGTEICGDCLKARIAEKAEQDYWLAQWNRAPLSERDPAKYRQDMIDAGRGHLLPDVVADQIDQARMRWKDRA